MLPKPAWHQGVCSPLPGLRVFWPIVEKAGAVRDAAQGRNSPFNMAATGTPAYSTGVLGRQVGGFGVGNYFGVDRPAGLGALSAFPIWLAVAFTVPAGNTTFGYAICCDTTGTASQQGIGVNNLASDKASYIFVDATGAEINLQGGPSINDARPHVALARSLTPTRHELWVDGLLAVASTSANALALGSNQHSLGLTRTGGATASPFPGQLQGAMLGAGGLPDPKAMAADFFATIRPRPARRAVLTTAAAAAAVRSRRNLTGRAGSRGISP